jgi:hypothetical protein
MGVVEAVGALAGVADVLAEGEGREGAPGTASGLTGGVADWISGCGAGGSIGGPGRGGCISTTSGATAKGTVATGGF